MSAVDDLLHSEAPLVLIEAAAGCGKTWTAAKFARETSVSLDLSRQRVLLLSHTHAACGEFHRRCSVPGLHIDVETCDSFALKVVSPYARALGLPFPLESAIGRVGGVAFGTLSEKAVELVRRAPIVARLISARYPVIILDEHQDASSAQHDLAMLLMKIGGSRLRIFGDPMQALHDGVAGEFVDWGELWRSCSDRHELTDPKRWPEAPELGQWITAARSTLRRGAVLQLKDAPASVLVTTTTGLAGRKKFKNPQLASEILHSFLDAGTGRAVIIAHLGDMVRTLAQCCNWRAGVNEGAALEHLDRLLMEAEADEVSAQALASAFLVFVASTGSGFQKAMREGLRARLGKTLDQRRSGKKQVVWLRALAAIYQAPNHHGLAAAMDIVMRETPSGYRIRLSDHASTLCVLGRSDDPRGHLQALSRLRRRRSLPPLNSSTVHKAKGLEFRRVLVCPADQHQYPATPYGARLLYVAMSRATHQLTIVTDTSSPVAHFNFG